MSITFGRMPALAVVVSSLGVHAAQAQTVTCDDLQELQTLGLQRFSTITGPSEYAGGAAAATLVLPGAEKCEVDFLDTTYPKYECTWTGFADEDEAEGARLDLADQVRTCLPEGFRERDRNSELGGSSNYYTRFTVGDLQPTIVVARRYSRATERYSVMFTFNMDLPEGTSG
jgi:hypothetical protein